jgi:hypothetical protein
MLQNVGASIVQNERNRYDRREPKRRGTREVGRTTIGREELQAGSGRLDQEPRRPVIPEMVLAIVVETKATIANARATTITVTPFSDNALKGRYASKC